MKQLMVAMGWMMTLTINAQNLPVFRNWYTMQGLYNPAMAGSYGLKDVTMVNRRQWTGTDSGPVAYGLYFQHAGRHRISYAFSTTVQDAVRLRNTDTRMILAYQVPLSADLSLRFGMSAGLATRKLNLGSDDYSNDPAILRAADGIYGLAGSFGIALEGSRFQLGAALPAVLPQENYSPAQLAAVGNSQLLSQWYSLRYRFRSATGKVEVDPWVVYRVLRDQRRNAEAGVNVILQDMVTLGLGYNQTLGPALVTGISLTEGLGIGWTWEPGMGKGNTFGATHEFRVTLRVGKARTTLSQKASMGATTSAQDVVLAETAAPKTQTGQDRFRDGPATPLSHGFYIVAGMFDERKEAFDMVFNLHDRGYKEAGMGFDQNAQKILVYLKRGMRHEEVEPSLARFRKLDEFSAVEIREIGAAEH